MVKNVVDVQAYKDRFLFIAVFGQIPVGKAVILSSSNAPRCENGKHEDKQRKDFS